MIRDPIQRTRALYAWERADLTKRAGVRRVPDAAEAAALVSGWWRAEGPARERAPVVRYRRAESSYCLGRALIVLVPGDREIVTLAHEFEHARGYGSPGNPHSPGFVRAYLERVALACGWNPLDLFMGARERGLL